MEARPTTILTVPATPTIALTLTFTSGIIQQARGSSAETDIAAKTIIRLLLMKQSLHIQPTQLKATGTQEVFKQMATTPSLHMTLPTEQAIRMTKPTVTSTSGTTPLVHGSSAPTPTVVNPLPKLLQTKQHTSLEQKAATTRQLATGTPPP